MAEYRWESDSLRAGKVLCKPCLGVQDVPPG